MNHRVIPIQVLLQTTLLQVQVTARITITTLTQIPTTLPQEDATNVRAQDTIRVVHATVQDIKSNTVLFLTMQVPQAVITAIHIRNTVHTAATEK